MLKSIGGLMMTEFYAVGKRIPRIDANKKVTGQAKYGVDVELPGMLIGKILRSPYPHCRVTRIDASKARRIAGVRAVITASDAPRVKYSHGHSEPDELLLAADKVRYAGESIAAVAAIDEDTAEEALDCIDVEYEVLPAVFHPEEAIKPNAPQIHQGVERNIAMQVEFQRGNIEKGFEESYCIVHERFTTPFQNHCCLENPGCVANFDASGKLTIWTSTAGPFLPLGPLAEVLCMNRGDIRIIHAYVGGAFGNSKDGVPLRAVAALLSRKSGKPVKIVNTREEVFFDCTMRVRGIIQIKMGASRDGLLLAKETRILADNGAYTGISGLILDTMARRIDNAYSKLSNISTRASLVYTNNPPTGAFRGFGNPQAIFAFESTLDILAEKLGMDPMEIRLKNVTKKGDVTAHGWVVKSCGLSECIHRIAEKAGWKDRNKKAPGKGMGMGCVIHICGRRTTDGFAGASALAKPYEDGKLLIISGEVDVGQGSDTVLAQIAAEEMGIEVEDINVMPLDTNISPFSWGSHNDRVTITGGNAVRLAVMDVKRQLLETAAEMLEANMDDLIIRNKSIYVKGSPEKKLAISEAIRVAQYRRNGSPIIGRGSFDPDTQKDDPVTKMGNIGTAYSFGSHAVELEVDVETGKVKVLSIVAAHDLGRAVNPMAAEGQIEGAIAQGMGFCILENHLRQDGIMLNPNILDYKIPTSLDLPAVKTVLIETVDPVGPFGAKGVAEPALSPVAPAIANAIKNAIGIRIRDLPITPERIIQALEAAQE